MKKAVGNPATEILKGRFHGARARAVTRIRPILDPLAGQVFNKASQARSKKADKKQQKRGKR